MDAFQSNKLAMYRAVLALLNSPTAPLAGFAPLPAKLAAFAAKVTEITDLAATQAAPLSGAVQERDDALTAARDAALTIAGIVLSHADERRLPELVAQVQLKPSSFLGRKEKTVQLAQQVHDAAQSVLPDLAPYGLTEARLGELRTAIAAATASLSGPRSATAAKKAATAQLDTVFRDADRILENQIDPLLVPLAKTKPEFYSEYRATRTIVDRRGARRGSPDGEPETTTAPTPTATPGT